MSIPSGKKEIGIEIRFMNKQDDNYDEYVVIEIEEKQTGFRFLEIKMSHNDFIKSVVGNSIGNAKASIIATEHIEKLGTKMLNREELVKVPKGIKRDTKEFSKFVDGLVKKFKAHSIRSGDIFNSHRLFSSDEDGSTYRVVVWYFENPKDNFGGD